MTGACTEREERFAESFAKWASGDLGVDLSIGYQRPAARSVARGVGRAAGRPRRPLTGGPPAPGPGSRARRGAPPGDRPAGTVDRRACPRSSPPASPTPTRAATCCSATSPSRCAPGRHAGSSAPTASARATLLRMPGRRARGRRGRVALGGRARPTCPRTSASTATGGRSASCCSTLAPARVRAAGRAMLEAERELDAGDDPAEAGMRLGEAIATWSELGGYELEGALGRRLPARSSRAGLRRGRRPRRADQLSGGERKQLVLELAVRLRRRRPAARRARQLPRRPRQARAGGAHPRRRAKTILLDQPRPRAAGHRDATRSSRSRATAPGSTAGPTRPTPRRASTARS